MKYVELWGMMEFLGAGKCAAGRQPMLGADIHVLLLAFTCSEGENSKSTAEGRMYMNAKDKKQYRDTIKMLSRDF